MTPTKATRISRHPLDGRWQVYEGGRLIGWVIKHGDHWRAYVWKPELMQGLRVDWGFFRTRREAISEVEIQAQ